MDSLPASFATESFVLGAILSFDDVPFPKGLSREHFSDERHRRIWSRMCDLHAGSEAIDRVTVYTELQKRGEVERDTLSFLMDLDAGVPHVFNLDSHIRRLQEHAARRRIIFPCQNLMEMASSRSEDLSEIMAAGQELFNTAAKFGAGYKSIEDLPILAEFGSAKVEHVREPELPCGAVVALTGDSGSGKSTLVTALARDAWRFKGIPSLFLDPENPISVIADRMKRSGMEDGPGIRFWGGWLSDEPPLTRRANRNGLGPDVRAKAALNRRSA